MADPTNPPADKPTDKTADKAAADKAMTAAQAAKAVRRPVVGKDGKVSLAAVKADEVLAFRDYGTHVVVVTVDGQKFSSASAEQADA